VVVTADAMHCQKAHADYLVLQRGAHYILTVKMMALSEIPQSCSLKFPSWVSCRRAVCAGQRPSGDGFRC
jgi:predicted transposase YbfD/YdcC